MGDTAHGRAACSGPYLWLEENVDGRYPGSKVDIIRSRNGRSVHYDVGKADFAEARRIIRTMRYKSLYVAPLLVALRWQRLALPGKVMSVSDLENVRDSFLERLLSRYWQANNPQSRRVLDSSFGPSRVEVFDQIGEHSPSWRHDRDDKIPLRAVRCAVERYGDDEREGNEYGIRFERRSLKILQATRKAQRIIQQLDEASA